MKSEKKYFVKHLRKASTIFSYSLILFMAACSTPTVSSDDSDESDESTSVNYETLATPCKTKSEDKCEYGELKDERDGKVYKTVKIGEQVWMAENLNYETEKGSSCYDDDADNCTKFGRLYTWAPAVGKSDSECGYLKTCNLGKGNVQGVCPSGWHLPSKAEWNTLIMEVDGSGVNYGMETTMDEYHTNVAGKALKSQTGWDNGGNGTDAFGFSALPAGDWISGKNYLRLGETTGFWSSTEADSVAYAWLVGIDYGYSYVFLNDFVKYRGISVRCVKD